MTRAIASERGGVASWLILAAGLAIAASFAAYGLGLITVGLTNDVAEAAQVDVEVVSPIEAPSFSHLVGDQDAGDPADNTGDPGSGAPGPGDGAPPSSDYVPVPEADPGSDPGSEGGEPHDPELLEWWASLTLEEQAEFCRLSSSLCDLPPPPRDPSEPVPACFDVENPDTWYSCAPLCSDEIHYSICWTDSGCFDSGLNQCADDGTCTSFHEHGCSNDPAVHEAIAKGEHYERCAVAEPSIILCNNYPRGIEAGVAAYLRAEVGADPGDVFLLAAEVCAQGHPGCEFALEFANWYHDNRNLVLGAIIAGDIIPGPAPAKCAVAAIDGVTAGDAAECILGLATEQLPVDIGIGIPFPSGAVDDLIEGE